MDKKFKVFSTLADTIVFSGAESECKDYKQNHESNYNSLYVLRPSES